MKIDYDWPLSGLIGRITAKLCQLELNEVPHVLPVFPKRDLMKLGKSYQRVGAALNWPDKDFYGVADTVSLWSPAQHLYHIGVVNKLCLEQIKLLYEDEDPRIVKQGGPTIKGHIVLLMGKIPVGRGKAPAETVASDDILREDVKRVLDESKMGLRFVAEKLSLLLDLRGKLPHPALGHFEAIHWLKFAHIHTNHHMAIVEKIPGSPSLVDMRDR